MKPTYKDRFLALVSEQDNASLDAIKWRAENREWLKKSQATALKILQTLKAKKMTQKDLAELMGISPQQVNKWAKGKENFTFETISKIEQALDVQLMQIGVNTTKEIKVEIEISYPQQIRKVHSSVGNYKETTHNEPKIIPFRTISNWNKEKVYGYYN